jgi:hypothetical protein
MKAHALLTQVAQALTNPDGDSAEDPTIEIDEG